MQRRPRIVGPVESSAAVGCCSYGWYLLASVAALNDDSGGCVCSMYVQYSSNVYLHARAMMND